MTHFIKSDLVRNFGFGFLIGAAALAFTTGEGFIPAAIASVIA